MSASWIFDGAEIVSGEANWAGSNSISEQQWRQKLTTLEQQNVQLEKIIHRYKRREKQLMHQAAHDDLTGLFDRRHWLQQLAGLISSAKRYSHTLSLCICDLDEFKSVNDTYGHQVGDKILVEFSQLLQKEIRTEDIAGRLGGDEFCIIFPHIPVCQAFVSVERIRQKLQKHHFNIGGLRRFSLTASFGVTDLRKIDRNEADLRRATDEALYRAKRRGGNQTAKNESDIGGSLRFTSRATV
jgi:diguanylate cyclase (GGDEF)-like protein